MQAHPTRRRAIRRRGHGGGAVCRSRGPGAGRPGHKRLSPSARRKGDSEVPFRILSTATLRLARGLCGLLLFGAQLAPRSPPQRSGITRPLHSALTPSTDRKGPGSEAPGTRFPKRGPVAGGADAAVILADDRAPGAAQLRSGSPFRARRGRRRAASCCVDPSSSPDRRGFPKRPCAALWGAT